MKINWNPVENQKIFHTNTNINSLEIKKNERNFNDISMEILWISSWNFNENGNPGEIQLKFK